MTANPNYRIPPEPFGPKERHPTSLLTGAIEAMNRLGKPKCVVCGKRGMVALGIEGQLTVHHRIPKSWWKCPGQAVLYYRWRRYRGGLYYRDFGYNMVLACHDCHGGVTQLGNFFPDMMGDKLRRNCESVKEWLSTLGRKTKKAALLLPDCVWEQILEDDLEELRRLLRERAVQEV